MLRINLIDKILDINIRYILMFIMMNMREIDSRMRASQATANQCLPAGGGGGGIHHIADGRTVLPHTPNEESAPLYVAALLGFSCGGCRISNNEKI